MQLLEKLITVVKNNNCGLFNRTLLRRWSIYSRPASSFYLPLLWKNGVYRISIAGTRNIGTQWCLHWSCECFMKFKSKIYLCIVKECTILCSLERKYRVLESNIEVHDCIGSKSPSVLVFTEFCTLKSQAQHLSCTLK